MYHVMYHVMCHVMRRKEFCYVRNSVQYMYTVCVLRVYHVCNA